MWTLVYGGVEKALADWAICVDVACAFKVKGRGEVVLRSLEAFDAATPQFAWGNGVKIWQDRTAVGTGGTLYFQGYIGDLVRTGEGRAQAIGYRVWDAWWLLERLKFQQGRQVFNGYTVSGDATSAPTFRTVLTSEVYFGEDQTETPQTNGWQVGEILAWLNECWNPTKRGATSGRDNSQDVVQVGTIDPAVNIPKSRGNEVYCDQALQTVLRWSPDAVPFLDYTTTPPTFKVRALGNLTEVALTISAEQEKQLRVAPRYDRQVPGVIITYKRTDFTDGVPWPVVVKDVYPGGVSEYTPTVATLTVELAGAQVTHVTTNVEVSAVADAVTGGATARKDWWLGVDNTLNDPLIDPATVSVTAAMVVDDSGTAVDLGTYPNRLVSGQLAEWMGVHWIEATIKAKAKFTQYAGSSTTGGVTTLVGKTHAGEREVTHKAILTNATTRAFRAVSYRDPGESVPTGVAQAVYTSLATLQYEGSITLTGAQLRAGVKLGTKLKLIGPNNTFENLIVQGINTVPARGTMEVSFGPSASLDAPELIELARVTSRRLIYNMPSGRSNGTAAGGSDVGLGDAVGARDTQHGVPAGTQHAVVLVNGDGSMNSLAMDGPTHELRIAKLEATGGESSTPGYLSMKMGVALPGGGTGPAFVVSYGGVVTTIYNGGVDVVGSSAMVGIYTGSGRSAGFEVKASDCMGYLIKMNSMACCQGGVAKTLIGPFKVV